MEPKISVLETYTFLATGLLFSQEDLVELDDIVIKILTARYKELHEYQTDRSRVTGSDGERPLDSGSSLDEQLRQDEEGK
jgi:hypothetical protein